MKEKEKNQELLKKLDRTKEEAKKGKILIPIEIVYYVIKFLHQAGEKFAYINFEDNDFLSLELYDQTYSYDASGVWFKKELYLYLLMKWVQISQG